VVGGDGQDVPAVAVAFGPELAGQVGAGDVGEQQVDDDQLEVLLPGGGQAVLSGGGLGDLVAGGPEGVGPVPTTKAAAGVISKPSRRPGCGPLNQRPDESGQVIVNISPWLGKCLAT
jgi:hypothetical protein